MSGEGDMKRLNGELTMVRTLLDKASQLPPEKAEAFAKEFVQATREVRKDMDTAMDAIKNGPDPNKKLSPNDLNLSGSGNAVYVEFLLLNGLRSSDPYTFGKLSDLAEFLNGKYYKQIKRLLQIAAASLGETAEIHPIITAMERMLRLNGFKVKISREV